MTNQASTGVSRRSFLGMGAMAALAAGTGLAATKLAFAEEAEAAEGIEWADEADAVICGAGGAGMAAAIEVTAAGGTALVLEMGEAAGGATRMSGGTVYCGGGTRLQKDCGIEDSLDNMKAYVKAVTLPSGGNEELVDLYCEKSSELFDWMEECGIQFQGTAELEGRKVGPTPGISLKYTGNELGWEYTQVATAVPRGHTPSHEDMAGASVSLFDPLLATAEANGARIQYNTEATELIQDETGRVIGVYATVDGETKAYKANSGVVLTTGAFTLNNDMLADYCPEGLVAGGKTAHPNDLGSGIRMGMRIGAATRSMGIGSLQRFIYIYGAGPTRGILVDQSGVRLVDESSYANWVARAIYHFSPEAAYIIMDDEMANDLNTIFGEPNFVAEADTVEELAEAIGINANALAHSVSRYNELAEGGEDLDFHKAANYLAPIEKAPFHAALLTASDCTFFTLGGLKINRNAEVLDLDGKVIPGLYSAGRNACAIFGNYPGSGCSIGEGLMFGRIAGQSIMAGPAEVAADEAEEAPAEQEAGVDCSPCHGDAHTFGEENPHGY